MKIKNILIILIALVAIFGGLLTVAELPPYGRFIINRGGP